jgi:hypothetical protein
LHLAETWGTLTVDLKPLRGTIGTIVDLDAAGHSNAERLGCDPYLKGGTFATYSHSGPNPTIADLIETAVVSPSLDLKAFGETILAPAIAALQEQYLAVFGGSPA